VKGVRKKVWEHKGQKGNAYDGRQFTAPKKHVIYAAGPKAHEKSNRQDNFDLVQRTVLSSLEHA